MNGFPDSGAEREAAEWFVRLQSDAVQEEDWTAFEAWLAADVAHQSTFRAVEDLWIDLDLAESEHAAALKIGQLLPFRRRSRPLSWGAWAALGGAAAALLLLAVFAPRFGSHEPKTATQTITTAMGERKTVILADGTRLDLNSASTAVIDIGRRERLVRLVKGEAAFTVKHDPTRLFAVMAEDRRITDIGTMFDVAHLDNAVEVTVKTGEVTVASISLPQHAIEVAAGKQLVHSDGVEDSVVKAVNTDSVMAWRNGRLIYRNASLQNVAADLSRYFPTPIRVKGAKAAELRFSGVLVLDSEDAVVGRLRAFLPVAAERSNDGVWLTARR